MFELTPALSPAFRVFAGARGNGPELIEFMMKLSGLRGHSATMEAVDSNEKMVLAPSDVTPVIEAVATAGDTDSVKSLLR
jgi:hypothetical protein